LLKTETLDAQDRRNISTLLIVLVVLVVGACVGAIGVEVRSAKLWLKETRERMHAFKIMFRGEIRPTRGVPCIASFPGKYEDEWQAIVELGREASSSLSVACVFLPQNTPDFGRHVRNREDGGGRCYCHTIYGVEKTWGCAWFELWANQVLLAHSYGQPMHVFYFKGQVGKGKVLWKDLAWQAQLRDRVMGDWPQDDAGWPKIMGAQEEAIHIAGLTEKEQHCVQGLGGSQKAEVAWMDAHGIAYEEHNVEVFGEKIRSMAAEGANQKTKHESMKPGANPMHHLALSDVSRSTALSQPRLLGQTSQVV
jgi:hypothetical protein